MSVVAISETAGSQGTEIGRLLAAKLGYEFADREIISKAAERFGETATDLMHATEEKPTLWDRVRESQRRYLTYVEAILFEMAAADNAVLVGRGAAIVLARFPHVLRVRMTAAEATRARRIRDADGLTPEAAADDVRRCDHDRAARLRFFYHVDWDDARLYDLVLNTDRIGVPCAMGTIAEVLRAEQFRTVPASRGGIVDASLAAQARAALLRHPLLRSRHLAVGCSDGIITLSGTVGAPADRTMAEQAVAPIPGVGRVQNNIVTLHPSYRSPVG